MTLDEQDKEEIKLIVESATTSRPTLYFMVILIYAISLLTYGNTEKIRSQLHTTPVCIQTK